MKSLQTAAMAQAEAAWLADRVHAIGAVPTTPAKPYLTVGVASGSAQSYSLNEAHGTRTHRLVVMAVGTTATEVGFAVEKADAAFLDRSLTVTGIDCGPISVESSSPIIRDPDDNGLLVCTVVYTFTTGAHP